MSISIINPASANPSYILSGNLDFNHLDSGTYSYNITGNSSIINFINSNIITQINQTGSLVYENTANTQTAIYNNINVTNSGVNFQSVGTKRLVISDNVNYTSTTISGIGNIFIGNNSNLTITTLPALSGTINVGCDENLVAKNNSIITITTVGNYVINVYGNNCVINVSNCQNLTVRNGSFNCIIRGTNNNVTLENESSFTKIQGTQATITDNGKGNENIQDSQTVPQVIEDVYKIANSSLAYWDGLNSPFIANNSSPTGLASGAAVFINNSEGVRLTLDGVNSSSGAINFRFRHIQSMRIQFRIRTFASGGVGTGADAIWFYCYCDNVPTTEYGTSITRGYIISFSEFHDQITLNWGTGGDHNGTAYPATIAFTPKNSITNLDNNIWRDVDIYFIANRIQIYLDNVKLIDYTDVYNRDITCDYFGFAARTGGVTASHFVKNFVVTKLGDNISTFNINNKMPIYSGIFYDRLNERIGINNINPSEKLDVVGNSNLSGNVNINGNVVLSSSNSSITSSGNSLTITGGNNNLGLILTGSISPNGNLVLNSTTNATKGNVRITENTESFSTNSGALVVTGGLGVGESIFCNQLVSGNIRINNNSNSISNVVNGIDMNLVTLGTGRVSVSADPTANLHVSTKQYVDNALTRDTYYCVADQSVINSTTLVDSIYLSNIPLVTGRYMVRGILFFNAGNATPDLRLTFIVNTSTVNNIRLGINKYLTGTTQVVVSTNPTNLTNIALSNSISVIEVTGTLEVTNAGTFNVRFAQNTVDAAQFTRLQRGSFLNICKF